MTRDSNPFEPWRPPPERTPTEPRQPPESEQRDTLRRLAFERWPSVTSPQGLLPSNWLTLFVLVCLGAFGAYLLFALPGHHLPRIAFTLLALALGFGVALSLPNWRRWRTRLACLGAGLGAAALAWWFVPTTNGRNLWTAQAEASECVADLDELAAGDGLGYEAKQKARQALCLDFPEFRPRIEEAERSWLDRSIPYWASALANLAPGDYTGIQNLRPNYQHFPKDPVPAAETAWLERTYRHLAPGDDVGVRRARAEAQSMSAKKEQIGEWERAWAERTITAVVKEVDPALKQKPDQASTRLRQVAHDLAAVGDYPSAQSQLLAARRRAAQARLELARQELRALIAADRFAEAASTAAKLTTDWDAEARALDLANDFTRLRDSYAFLADLARQAKPDAK
jgi:hypothetical protein